MDLRLIEFSFKQDIKEYQLLSNSIMKIYYWKMFQSSKSAHLYLYTQLKYPILKFLSDEIPLSGKQGKPWLLWLGRYLEWPNYMDDWHCKENRRLMQCHRIKDQQGSNIEIF